MNSAPSEKEQTLYELLGLTPDATAKEIKDAHRKLAKMYHPDLNPDDEDAAAQFLKVNAAYTTLSDPEARTHYDRTGLRKGTDDTERRAYDEICNLFAGMVGAGERIFKEPVIPQIHNNLVNAMKREIRKIDKAKEEIEFLSKLPSCIHTKPDAPRVLNNVIEMSISDRNKDISKAKSEMAVFERGTEILEDYAWSPPDSVFKTMAAEIFGGICPGLESHMPKPIELKKDPLPTKYLGEKK